MMDIQAVHSLTCEIFFYLRPNNFLVLLTHLTGPDISLRLCAKMDIVVPTRANWDA